MGENVLGSSRQNQWRVSAQVIDMRRPEQPVRAVKLGTRDRSVIFDLQSTAIIVVDMQNDFCHPDGWLGHIGVDVTPARAPIAPLQALLPALRAAEVPVIWLNWGNRADKLNLSPALLHVYNPYGTGVGLGDPLPVSGAPVLQAGSWAAEVVDELMPNDTDIRVNKYRMSGFHDSELDSILRNLNVTTLLFAGVNVDQCVLCTLQEANFRGYDCLLLEDCSATTSPDYCRDATLYNVQQCFGFVVNAAELQQQLESNI
ncbi:cysteine hydrolase family protein [Pantoea sp. NPDC088449]|uniref:Nicotinamidase-related amidase n=1 Tax=Candidatus Pantoea floridensis TaxID=1938870 RepID=A0A286DM41_9GAMM|nr:cysteine hydrolase family protein [Pantoea floridensis]PIF14717.1 nicotinamidase-related amidase [Enterobacteriaceae bacterium JKS000233]SOD59716.1 Nicotinamidase-related amidase [Pantoea floridensis]HBZ15544.1 isochorismatase [Pantoea sp.]